VCRCSNISTLKLNNIPKYYRNLIHSWSKFNNNLLQSRTIDEILEGYSVTQILRLKTNQFASHPFLKAILEQ